MLFSAPEFVFGFLPLVLIGFYLIKAFASTAWARVWLIAASLFFYGYWNPNYLLLILTSIAVNYLAAGRILNHELSDTTRTAWYRGGIAFNLLLLGYFKYSFFIASSVHGVFSDLPLMWQVTLPLGISFFTFQQVAFLADVRREGDKIGRASPDVYSLFVLFFPQLIAGPIVHHKILVPQLADDKLGKITINHLKLGVGIFLLGLFKKAVIADNLAEIIKPIFRKFESGMDFSAIEAWMGILVYTFRLYFDFSAYSDMAVGLGLLFGVILPLNFFSPYKAASINETWQRWNITLGQFFGNYVYRPLGATKRGHLIAVRNLMILMLCSGIWHGAGWNFILWGAIQGLAMGIAYLWAAGTADLITRPVKDSTAYRWLFAIPLTFSFWVISLVPFRISGLSEVGRYYSHLFSIKLTDFDAVGQQLTSFLASIQAVANSAGDLRLGVLAESAMATAACFLIVFALPNTMQYFGVTRMGRIGSASVSGLQALWVGVAGALAISHVLSRYSNEFIYFAF